MSQKEKMILRGGDCIIPSFDLKWTFKSGRDEVPESSVFDDLQ
jgi:hypothetical protein